MVIRSVEKAGLIRWLVLFCVGFLFGCAVSLGYVPFWLQTECFIDGAPIGQSVCANHRSDQIGSEGKQRSITIRADFEPLASDVEKPAHHANADDLLVRRAQPGVRTNHGQLCCLVEEVLKEWDVYFTLGIAQDHLANAFTLKASPPIKASASANRAKPKNTMTGHGSHSSSASTSFNRAVIKGVAGLTGSILTVGSIPRNTPAAHPVLSNWAKHVNPNKEVA